MPLAFTPTTTEYNHYLAACVSAGDDKDAALLAATLAEMKQRGLAPSPWTFNPHAWLAFKQNSWKMADVRGCAPRTRHDSRQHV